MCFKRHEPVITLFRLIYHIGFYPQGKRTIAGSGSRAGTRCLSIDRGSLAHQLTARGRPRDSRAHGAAAPLPRSAQPRKLDSAAMASQPPALSAPNPQSQRHYRTATRRRKLNFVVALYSYFRQYFHYFSGSLRVILFFSFFFFFEWLRRSNQWSYVSKKLSRKNDMTRQRLGGHQLKRRVHWSHYFHYVRQLHNISFISSTCFPRSPLRSLRSFISTPIDLLLLLWDRQIHIAIDISLADASIILLFKFTTEKEPKIAAEMEINARLVFFGACVPQVLHYGSTNLRFKNQIELNKFFNSVQLSSISKEDRTFFKNL